MLRRRRLGRVVAVCTREAGACGSGVRGPENSMEPLVRLGAMRESVEDKKRCAGRP
jgi:hypothetical protein